MECAVHPGTAAAEGCDACSAPACADCLRTDGGGRALCQGCDAAESERSVTVGSTLLVAIAAAYLAALAVGYVVFKGRPFVGGLAAVVAIGLGRGLQRILYRQ